MRGCGKTLNRRHAPSAWNILEHTGCIITRFLEKRFTVHQKSVRSIILPSVQNTHTLGPKSSLFPTSCGVYTTPFTLLTHYTVTHTQCFKYSYVCIITPSRPCVPEYINVVAIKPLISVNVRRIISCRRCITGCHRHIVLTRKWHVCPWLSLRPLQASGD